MLRRSPLKKSQKPLKKTSLKKENPATAKQKHEDRKIQRQEDDVFYEEVIAERKSISDLTDNYIPNATKFNVHHLLPKGIEKYKQFRHKKWNVILVESTLHSQIETCVTNLPEEFYDRLIRCFNNAKEKAGI